MASVCCMMAMCARLSCLTPLAVVVCFVGDEAVKQQSIMQVLREQGHSSAAVSRRLASKWPKPAWHAPWKMYRVISGHLG